MYYVYIYLDPRKPGRYQYGDYCFLYEPFYVGKGKGNRYETYKNRNNYFINKINKIESIKLKPIVVKIYCNLSESKSIYLEIKLIKIIGRKDLNEGTLVNMTDGGEGVSGLIFNDESKKKISEANKGKNNPMFGSNRCGKNNPMFGKKHSIETRRKLSIANSGENGPNYGKKFSYEHKKKIGDAQRGIKNHMAKLTIPDIIQIKLLLKEKKLTQYEISKKFNVSQKLISNIKLGKLWNHIGEK